MSVDTLWELICHHTYKWGGTATDLSVYDSHGATAGLDPSDFRQDGAVPGSGAWRFHATTRNGIVIRPNAGWGPLVGVRVEFTARINTVGFAVDGATLIDADSSFHIAAYQRRIGASFRGDPALYGPSWDWVVSNFQMKNNQWVRFVWEHDGLSEMRLIIEGAEIVRHLVLSSATGSTVDAPGPVTSTRSRSGASIPTGCATNFSAARSTRQPQIAGRATSTACEQRSRSIPIARDS